MAALFEVKRSWKLDELTPYVIDLVDPGAKPEKLVLIDARAVHHTDGSTSYVPRWPK